MPSPGLSLPSLALAVAAVAAGCARAASPRPLLAPTAPAAPAARAPAPPPPATRSRPLLDLDWAHVEVVDDAAALALWRRIAPTGEDWEDKLLEVPSDRPVARALALALLREGRFACAAPAPPPGACPRAAVELPPPSADAGLDDPCLRRLLALWALGQLEPGDAPALAGPLEALASLPPPESELTEAVLRAIPEDQPALALRLIAAAAAAGQRELADVAAGALDEPHLLEALTLRHLDGALIRLDAAAHRPAFLGAVLDERLRAGTRIQAMHELAASEDPLAAETRGALAAAARGADCAVAAAAARLLDRAGDHRFVPRRPTTRRPEELMRGLCVLASYEAELGPEEGSPLATYLPARGLELARVTLDPFSTEDADGDGDPHTEHHAELVPPGEAALPEPADLAAALAGCAGTTCASDEHEFRFTLRPGRGGTLELARLEVVDRPACAAPAP